MAKRNKQMERGRMGARAAESKPRMDADERESAGTVAATEEATDREFRELARDAGLGNVAGSSTRPAELLQIEPAQLVPTPDNARGEVDEKSESFGELVASIKGDGVRVPLQARPIVNRQDAKNAEERYEVLDGARRLVAAKAAGRATVPVLVYRGISDEEAFKIVLAANFAREDLTPLQQGRAVEILLQKRRGDVAAVAADMGQSVQWVALRARLGKLSARWKKAIEKGEFAGYGVGHLELVARLPEAVQESMMVKDQWGGRGLPRPREYFTVRELERFLDGQFVRALAKAPWDIEDVDLCPQAGPCNECPKRSSREAMLFGSDGSDGSDGSTAGADRCLDAVCYAVKHLAWLARRKKEVEMAAGRKLAPVVTEDGDDYRDKEWGAAKKALGADLARKDYCDKIVAKEPMGGQGEAAFAVDGPHAGKVVWVVKAKKARTGASGRSTDGKAHLAAKKAEQFAERRRYAEDFAAAASAAKLAQWIAEVGDDATLAEIQRTQIEADLCDLCVVYRMAEGGMPSGPGWDWLRVQLGVAAAEKQKRGPVYEHVQRPHELNLTESGWGTLRARAMAVFLCERDTMRGEPIFAEPRKNVTTDKHGSTRMKANQKSETRNQKSKLPANPARRAEVMAAAAEKFIIDSYFLAKLTSASVQVVARELGVKCKSARGATVEAILAAGLPPGRMTVELARAFGVKYVEPKNPKKEKNLTTDEHGSTRMKRKKLNRQDAKDAADRKKLGRSLKKAGAEPDPGTCDEDALMAQDEEEEEE